MEIKQETRLHCWVQSENDTRLHCQNCGLYEDYGHLPCEPWFEAEFCSLSPVRVKIDNDTHALRNLLE
jgi:hypothetical protein